MREVFPSQEGQKLNDEVAKCTIAVSGEFRNEWSDKFWWKSVLVDLCWAPGEAVHDAPHVFVISKCVRL